MTGLEMEAIISSQTVSGMQVYCTEDSSAYTAGKHYRRALDNNSFEVVGLDAHTHTDADSGGRLDEVTIANMTTSLLYDKRFARANSFYQTVVTGGTVLDVAASGRIELSTGTTNGASAMIVDGGRKLDFTQPSAFEARLRVTSGTNYTLRAGIGAEVISAANDTVRKYGLEACSTTGSVWLVFSSDGTTRSTLTTAANVVTGVDDSYFVQHTPATSITLTINNVLSATKTTNVPSTSTTSIAALYRAGIKNSAAENKQLLHYGGPIIAGALG
jgi:hypothetical protein